MPSVSELEKIITTWVAEAERLRGDRDYWKQSYERCNERVCQLLEEKLAGRSDEQSLSPVDRGNQLLREQREATQEPSEITVRKSRDEWRS